MRLNQLARPIAITAVLAGITAGAYLTRGLWMPWFRTGKAEAQAKPADESAVPSGKVLLTDQAIANLKLTAEPLKAGPYWKIISVPGTVIDRPGMSDRGVTTPVAGVVNTIHRLPGETVGPGTTLFKIGVRRESLHPTQARRVKAN